MPELPALDPDATQLRGAAVDDPSTFDQTGAYEPAPETIPRQRITPTDSPVIPGYIIGSLIAKGGMGRVWLGRDLTLDREVAIKTLLPGADAARFVTESKITAKLPHPGIPPVHAMGMLNDGSPYLVMKFVQGRTLAAMLAERATPTDDLPRFVQIFEQIAQAVGFAHSQGVIHRDLKPLNVMVGAFGEVQVMDWGLAKDMASRERERPEGLNNENGEFTQAGAIMGTPGYMAPEQARGEAVDARADVFALGAVLAAILTGKPAFVGGTVRETIAKAAQADLAGALDRLKSCDADAELVKIAKRCLKADADQRLPDGRKVAEAVAAYRTGVEDRLHAAKEAEAATQAREQEQRKRRRVMKWATGIVAAVLVAGIAGVLYQLGKTSEALGLASKNAIDFENASILAKTNETTAVKALANEKTALQNESAARNLEKEATLKQARNLYVAHMRLIQEAWERSELSYARQMLERQIPTTAVDPDFRGFEWYYYWKLTHSEQPLIKGLGSGPRAMAYSPDGKRFAAALEGGKVLVWFTDKFDKPATVPGVTAPARGLAFSPDSKYLAIGTSAWNKPGKIHVVDVTTLKIHKELSGHKHPIFALAYTADGALVSAAADIDNKGTGNPWRRFFNIHKAERRDGDVRMWSPASEEMLLPPEVATGSLCLAVSSDGRWLATGTTEGKAVLIDLKALKTVSVLGPHNYPMFSIAVTNYGSVFGGGGRWDISELTLWHRETGTNEIRHRPRPFAGHGGSVQAIALIDGGTKAITSSLDRTVRQWDLYTGETLSSYKGHATYVWCLATHPEKPTVLSGGNDSHILAWNLTRPQERIQLNDKAFSVSEWIEFSPLDNSVRTASPSLQAYGVWDPESGELLRKITLESTSISDFDKNNWNVEIDENPVRVTLKYDETSGVRGGARSKPWYGKPITLGLAKRSGNLSINALSSDGDWISFTDSIPSKASPSYAEGSRILFYSLLDGTLKHSVPIRDGMRDVQYSEDRKFVTMTGFGGHITVHDTVTGKQVAYRKSPSGAARLAISPDSRLVATAADDGIARVWKLDTLEPVVELRGNREIVYGVAFSPDSKTLATASWDSRVKLWDIETGEERLTLHGLPRPVWAVAFSADGRKIAAAYDGTGVVWNAATDAETPKTKKDLKK